MFQTAPHVIDRVLCSFQVQSSNAERRNSITFPSGCDTQHACVQTGT